MANSQRILRDIEDIEDFYLSTAGMRPNLLQLSASPINLHQKTVELGGVTLVWVTSQGRQWWRDEMAGEGLMFGYLVESTGSAKARGCELDRNVGQVWIAGNEMDYLLSGPLLSLEISVDADLVEELGWQFSGEPTRQVPDGRLDKLTQSCRIASSKTREVLACAHQHIAKNPIHFWRDQILTDLEFALEPWLRETIPARTLEVQYSHHHDIVKSAAAFFEISGEEDHLEIDQLAASLGVSRRTLFRSFRASLGIGPRRYFELKRLHALRSRLRQYSSSETTVTACANAEGFSELGRLSKLYRQQFGESPSETLKRGIDAS